MEKQVSTSTMFKELGSELGQAHEQHKDTEVDYGSGGNLPAGIEGGVARLVDCRFSQYKSGDFKDKWFFLAAGVVVYPGSHDGITISSMRTMIMEPVCDTPMRTRKTIAEHWRHVRNEILKLGVDAKSVSPKTIEKVAAKLKEEKPHFQFRTWVGKKQMLEERDGKCFVYEVDKAGVRSKEVQYRNVDVAKQANPFLGREPRVQEEWKGKCEAPQPNEAVDEVIDGLTDVTETEEQAPDDQGLDLMALAELADENINAEKSDTSYEVKVQKLLLAAGMSQNDIKNADSWVDAARLVDSTPSPETETSGEGSDEPPDFVSLGKLADNEDDDAIEKLEGLAVEAGLNSDNYPTWSELAEELAETPKVQNEGEAGDVDPFAIENVVSYRKRISGGRLGKNTIEVEVLSRNGDVFSVRNLDTNDQIDDVDVEQLSPIE